MGRLAFHDPKAARGSRAWRRARTPRCGSGEMRRKISQRVDRSVADQCADAVTQRLFHRDWDLTTVMKMKTCRKSFFARACRTADEARTAKPLHATMKPQGKRVRSWNGPLGNAPAVSFAARCTDSGSRRAQIKTVALIRSECRRLEPLLGRFVSHRFGRQQHLRFAPRPRGKKIVVASVADESGERQLFGATRTCFSRRGALDFKKPIGKAVVHKSVSGD